jgi:hypothetical protein
MVGCRCSCVPLTAILTAAGVAGPVVAQAGRVWIEPRAGWLVPTGDLGRTDVLGSTGFGEFEQVDQSAALGAGVGVEFGSGWALRASAARYLKAGVRGEWRCVPFVPCPSVILPLDGELDRWMAAIDALYRPGAGLPLNPVVFAGVGVRRSALRWNPPAVDVTLPAFSFADTEAVYRLGVGVERGIGPVQLFAEVDAMAGRFGGGLYETKEGNLPADRAFTLEMGLAGGVRLPNPVKTAHAHPRRQTRRRAGRRGTIRRAAGRNSP